jgi:hypothetical protein
MANDEEVEDLAGLESSRRRQLVMAKTTLWPPPRCLKTLR